MTVKRTRPERGFKVLRREAVVPHGIDETFAFFADAQNLNLLTPPWLGFEILTPKPIGMRAGTLIDYRIRIRGIPVPWRTEIVLWNPPAQFIDVQIKGPYRWWHHTHRFEPAPGGTRVIDEVEYLAPLAWLSHPLMVTRDVERIFDYRAEALAAELGGGIRPVNGAGSSTTRAATPGSPGGQGGSAPPHARSA